MQGLNASWLVRYTDGTETWQYDRSHPACTADGEVPYRAIEWDRVAQVVFESQYAKRVFDFTPPPPEFKVALRSRHFATMEQLSVMAFIVLTYPADKTQQDAVDALYWFPDDSTHFCHLFDCPEVRQYALGMLHDKPTPLSVEHNAKDVLVDAVLET